MAKSTEASRWLRTAAEQGHAEAQYNLGVMFDLGHGTEQNSEEAYAWLSKAAQQRIAEARKTLKF